MSKEKLRILMNAFFTLQFVYCPLGWMLHGRTFNNRINKLQGTALLFVYNDSASSFSNLLKKGNSFSQIDAHKGSAKILS